MKKRMLILVFLLLFTLACSFGGLLGGDDAEVQSAEPLQSENRCGDGVCDGPENQKNCPQDCSEQQQESQQGSNNTKTSGDYAVLYHVIENALTSYAMSNDTCYSVGLRRYDDAGWVNPDGSGDQVLDLKDNPTSLVTAASTDNYYYISTQQDPVQEAMGMAMFNWDVGGQTLYTADFASSQSQQLVAPTAASFPGGVSVSPDDQYLLYPMTGESKADQGMAFGMMQNTFNPFLNDSTLIIRDIASGMTTEVAAQNYNRQLFASLGDYSQDAESFYTITRSAGGFEFVRISLSSAEVTPFAQAFPKFDWSKVNWDAFFPAQSDFAYAYFAMSPDETRLLAYKNIFTANMQNTCVTEANHDLWVFDLEGGKLQHFQNQPGYVSSMDWRADSQQFAMAVVGNAGCYPDYLDSKIEIFSKDGQSQTTLVNLAKSKINGLGWSPDGSQIAYDVYSTDLVGRLEVVDVSSKQVTELVNTADIGYQAQPDRPMDILFSGWISVK